jgi:hypothetical protein
MATNKPEQKTEILTQEEAVESSESISELEGTSETPEIQETPEKMSEGSVEQEKEDQDGESQMQSEPVLTPSTSTTEIESIQEDLLSKEIENILQEDLTDMYLAMPPEKQKAFKQKGEETTGKIRKLVSATKVNTKKVFGLIKDWLKMIPGVNKFFLEQEAKIKTDKILLVTEEKKKRGETDFL